MTTRVKLEIVGTIVALIVLAIVGGSWLGAREEGIRLAATIDAQKSVIDSAQKEMTAHQEADKQRDAQTAATLQTMAQSVAKIQTPQQIAQWIPQQLTTPQPITITVPQPTAANPHPDATAIIPQADLPALRDQVSQCQVCSVKLTNAQADLASRDDQLKLAGAQLSATQKERDAAITAAKGGSKWTRITRAAKWLVIGGAVGAAAVCGSGHCK